MPDPIPETQENSALEPVARHRVRRPRLYLALGIILLLLVALIAPSLISLGQYQRQITRLVAQSVGRPVRLSRVQFRLLPSPAFLFDNLSIDEDPAFGAEPILYANSVVASIRLLSLARGRLEISRISVDEASLNLVRAQDGRWNLGQLFLEGNSPVVQAARQSAAVPVRLPYLEATHSRVNLIQGNEKQPFSLLETELSLTQDSPGQWRIRLRGQPVRSDLSLDLADTGILRLEATLSSAREVRQIPVHLQMEWKSAQLGQLTRLVLGSDAGWRGDLTGELSMSGTLGKAHGKAQLRATGVHRAEFAPLSTMDFDANCAFAYEHSDSALPQENSRILRDLICDSPLGDGRVHLTRTLDPTMPVAAGSRALNVMPAPALALELTNVPVQAALDGLRTVRNDFGPGLSAKGTVSGKLVYAPLPQGTADAAATRINPKRPTMKRATAASPFSGSLLVDGLELTGGNLRAPLRLPKIAFAPAAQLDEATGAVMQSLAATIPLPFAAPRKLTLVVSINGGGYRVQATGNVGIADLDTYSRVFNPGGSPGVTAALRGGNATLDLTAQGLWIPKTSLSPSSCTDDVSGTVVFHDTEWRADFLANPVELPAATVTVNTRQDIAAWSAPSLNYGPLKASATLTVPICRDIDRAPEFTLQAGAVDAAGIQTALLGAREPKTLVSTLLARLRPTAPAPWPHLNGTAQAESLALGAVTLKNPTLHLHVHDAEVQLSEVQAGLLGGSLRGSGTIDWTGDRPSYDLDLAVEDANSAETGHLLGEKWSGGPLRLQGKLALAGFTAQQLAASATGALHFDWQHGLWASIPSPAPSGKPAKHPAIQPFDDWTGDAAIAHGMVSIPSSRLLRAHHTRTVSGSLSLTNPPRLTLKLQEAPPSAHP